jgi:hypothetical protein
MQMISKEGDPPTDPHWLIGLFEIFVHRCGSNFVNKLKVTRDSYPLLFYFRNFFSFFCK